MNKIREEQNQADVEAVRAIEEQQREAAKTYEKHVVEVPPQAKAGSTVVVRLADDRLVQFTVPDGFEQISSLQGPYVAMEVEKLGTTNEQV